VPQKRYAALWGISISAAASQKARRPLRAASAPLKEADSMLPKTLTAAPFSRETIISALFIESPWP
jgi:hypothetical protein